MTGYRLAVAREHDRHSATAARLCSVIASWAAHACLPPFKQTLVSVYKVSNFKSLIRFITRELPNIDILHHTMLVYQRVSSHLDEHLVGQVDTELPMHIDAKTLTTRDGQEVTMVSDLMTDSGH
jgi:hypothetical protein